MKSQVILYILSKKNNLSLCNHYGEIGLQQKLNYLCKKNFISLRKGLVCAYCCFAQLKYSKYQ